ncbi:MAG: hypothetical protein SFY81_05810 [Verrucomicrobiota bacterium]|nr:hypothetical protein [Verrucomicrobiota bacterium]
MKITKSLGTIGLCLLFGLTSHAQEKGIPQRDEDIIIQHSVPPAHVGMTPAVGSGGRMAGMMMNARSGNRIWEPPFRHGPELDPLILRHSKQNSKVDREMKEDLKVMSRILEKAVESSPESSSKRAMGILILDGDATPRHMYIEGYGAVFLFNSGITLEPNKEQSADDKKKQDEPNSDWEEARRELFDHPDFPEEQIHLWAGGPLEPPRYDAEQVENLKKSVLKALRNGTNMRHLGKDEVITVVIQGGPRAVVHNTKIRKNNGEIIENELATFAFRGHPEDRATMTIQVRKADLQNEAIADRAKISIY